LIVYKFEFFIFCHHFLENASKERVKNLKKSSAQGNAAKRRSAEIRWEVEMAEKHEEEINQRV
jgi:hypothetical protein